MVRFRRNLVRVQSEQVSYSANRGPWLPEVDQGSEEDGRVLRNRPVLERSHCAARGARTRSQDTGVFPSLRIRERLSGQSSLLAGTLALDLTRELTVLPQLEACPDLSY